MALNINNQLDLLHDLLSLHADECCGEPSECEQITRLIQSIQQQPAIQQTSLINHVDHIKQYSMHGASSHNLNEHISHYQKDIEDWLKVIKDSNL